MVYSLRVAGVTDIGRVRERNEDRILLRPPLGVVADGMGGHLLGDEAAQAVVDQLESVSWAGLENDDERRAELVRSIRRAQIQIEMMVGNREQAGSTVAGALYCPGRPHWLIFHIGDSRAYLLRQGRLRRLTRDHSYVQGLVDEGEITEFEAKRHRSRSTLTRAIAARVEAAAEFKQLDARSDDVVVLCSDGLTNELSDDEIARIMVDMTSESPQAVAYALRDMALSRGGHDNVSAVILTIGHKE